MYGSPESRVWRLWWALANLKAFSTGARSSLGRYSRSLASNSANSCSTPASASGAIGWEDIRYFYCSGRKADFGWDSGAYQFWGTAAWGSQSWLQPPFEAARPRKPI